MELTIAEAADRLGVTTRQAQRLAATGRLQVVRRVGRTLIVEDTAVAALRHIPAGAGRRWSPRTAWAAIELLEHGSTTRLSGSSLSRLKRRLAGLDVEEFTHLAGDRARTQRMTQTRRRPAQLENALTISGRSVLKDPEVAALFGLAGGDSDIVEGYLHRVDAGGVVERFGLVPDAEGEVFLHVSQELPAVSVVATALDLAERGTTRERSAAREVLSRCRAGVLH